MKKICFISPGILPVPNTLGGAIETLLTNIITENEYYNKANITIISSYENGAYKISKSYKNTSIKYIKSSKLEIKLYNLLYRLIRKVFKKKLNFSSLYYLKSYRILKKYNYDYIVVEGGDYLELKKIVDYFGKKNIYLHIHHQLIPNIELDAIFDNIIGTSNFVNKEWERNSSNKNLHKYVVYNCVNENYFNKKISNNERRTIREKLGFEKDDFIVIYCGRIIKEKGVKELVQAVNLIENKKIKLLIVGSINFALECTDEYLRSIESFVKKSDNKIKFTGYIANEEVFKYYQTADVQVIPSICEEAAGLVSIEGMLSGLPLIVTKSGGLNEYVSDECSIKISKEKNLVVHIKEAIEKLYNDKNMYNNMKLAGLKRSNYFKMNKYYEDILNIFLGEEDEKK
ncbi:MAG: glycosyltransferase family 4 protein [Clostridium sp.]|jgi:spore coat protein SA|nr:glycosyltransferase family 4 protein [Clostridium sp.]